MWPWLEKLNDRIGNRLVLDAPAPYRKDGCDMLEVIGSFRRNSWQVRVAQSVILDAPMIFAQHILFYPGNHWIALPGGRSTFNNNEIVAFVGSLPDKSEVADTFKAIAKICGWQQIDKPDYGFPSGLGEKPPASRNFSRPLDYRLMG